MPTKIDQPTIIKAAGNKPKVIAELVGRVNTGTDDLSIARMTSPGGWSEPGQRPEFDEYTLVLRGMLRVTTRDGTIDVHAGQAVIAHAGQWVRYSTPEPEGAEYVAVCRPAFSPERVRRDDAVDPRRSSRRMATGTGAGERIFYDGDCGLCHWAVRFVVRRDGGDGRFRFAPLGGEAFRRLVPAAVAGGLPDSLVVRTADQRFLVRSRAVVHVLWRLGRGWRLLGWVLFLIPAPLRDFAYDRLAAVRRRLWARPEGSCPVLPQELARSFDA